MALCLAPLPLLSVSCKEHYVVGDHVLVEWEGNTWVLVDTAGIRRRGKTADAPEEVAIMMARRQLEQADLALLVVDAAQGVTSGDLAIAGTAWELGRPCVVLANTRLDVNKVVRKRLGTRKASFAGAEDTKALTGMEIGGVTPIGLPDGLPLLVDARVMARERIILGGGGRDRKVHAPPTLLTALGAEVVEDLAKPMPDA